MEKIIVILAVLIILLLIIFRYRYRILERCLRILKINVEFCPSEYCCNNESYGSVCIKCGRCGRKF